MTGLAVLWLGIPAAVLISAVLTGFFRQYALRVKLLDHPNDRSAHEVAIPRGGGVAVVATFLASTFFLCQAGYVKPVIVTIFFACGGLVALVGYIDDHHSVPAGIRFAVHLIAAASFLFLVLESPNVLLFPLDIVFSLPIFVLAVIGLVWLLNLYNFMDGIDAIAGLETISVAGGAAFIIWLHNGNYGHIFLLLFLAAATLGFLIWNWPPAKIFMGDACSGFLGFCLGVLALITSATGAINLWSWLILLSFFVADATVTLVRRVLLGEKFYEAHRSHAYQILARRRQSHVKVSMLFFFLNMIWALPLAVLASYYPCWSVLIAAFALFFPVLGAIKVGAGTTNN